MQGFNSVCSYAVGGPFSARGSFFPALQLVSLENLGKRGFRILSTSQSLMQMLWKETIFFNLPKTGGHINS